jgi:hypothetical protein
LITNGNDASQLARWLYPCRSLIKFKDYVTDVRRVEGKWAKVEKWCQTMRFKSSTEVWYAPAVPRMLKCQDAMQQPARWPLVQYLAIRRALALHLAKVNKNDSLQIQHRSIVKVPCKALSL